jgi:hypothetical protein
MAFTASAEEIDGFCITRRPPLQVIYEALDSPGSTVKDVGIVHGRFYVLMTEKFLNRSYIVAAFQKMCRR